LKLGGAVRLSSAKLHGISFSHIEYRKIRNLKFFFAKVKKKTKNNHQRRCKNGKGTTVLIQS
jgi:hypothetical protein